MKKISYNEIVSKLEKNISYHSFLVSKKCSIEMDDAKQEILLRMFKSYRKYNPKRSKYNTFFINVIKNESKRLVKTSYCKYKNVKIVRIYDKVFVNGKEIEMFTMFEDKKNNFLQRIEFNSFIESIIPKLNEDQKLIVDFLLKGFGLKEIGKELNITKQGVCNIIRRMRPIFSEEV